ncbi:MAG: hypothetical protein JWN78_2688 [Bacteroidota bacterium]|nr:hypothetical protein [Bacteroidota bacterium]
MIITAQNNVDYDALSKFYHSKPQLKLAKKLLREYKEGSHEKEEQEKKENKKRSADKRDESYVKDIPYGKFEEWNQYDKRKAANRPNLAPIFDTLIEIGPKREVGGRTRSILYDIANPKRVFAGAVSGGLWVSNNSGNSWNPVDDDAANLSVTSITQNPFDPKIIYYATGEKASTVGNGIYKSTDSGQTFHVLPTSLAITDFKFTWKIEHSLTDSNTIYVSTNSGELYRSPDGGTTWQKVFDVNQAVTDILILPDGSILLASSTLGIYKSPNGDPGTFVKINSPAFPIKFNIIELANCHAQPNIMYAAIGSQTYDDDLLAFCKSTDGGNTWSSLSVPTIIGTQGDYNLMLGVHPVNPNYIICGGVLTSFTTTGGTGAIPWIPTPIVHSDEHAYAFNPQFPNEFLIGNDGGIYQFNWNSILSPTEKNPGYRVTQFNGGSHEATGYGCLGGTQDNGTQKLNINANKIQVTFADGGYCHISQTNPNLAYVTQQYGYLHRSDNYASGVPLYSLATPPMADVEGTRFYNIYQMNYADDRQLYYRTNSGVWRTKNKGSNWERMGSDVFYTYWLECSKEYDPILYQFGQTSNPISYGLFRYENALTDTIRKTVAVATDYNICGGSSSCFYSDIEIHPFNNSTLLISKPVFDTFPKIFKVEKAETSTPVFTNVTGDLPTDMPVNAVAFDVFDPENTYYAATENGFYYTTNGGVNWIKETDIPNVVTNDIRIREDGTMFIFTFGRGVWAAKIKPKTKAYASIPYAADVENGNIDNYTSLLRSNPNGRIKASPTNDPAGNYSMQLNASSTDKAVTLRYDIRLNLSGQQNLFLKFDYKRFENTAQNDGIYISDNGGTTFKKAFNFKNNTLGTWSTDSVNLSRGIDSLHLSHSSTFVLRFQDSTKAEIPDGGMMVDNISVQERTVATGIKNHASLEESISVYPNPTSGVVNIQGLSNLKTLEKIELVDVNGKIIESVNIPDKNEILLNISHLPKAEYILKFTAKEGVFNKNIIKQ